MDRQLGTAQASIAGYLALDEARARGGFSSPVAHLMHLAR